ncbi:MAG: MotA/TolQ/ExbB proton channel family protein, partial [Terriglobales bacterium]
MKIFLFSADLVGGEIGNLIAQSGPVAKVVLAILLLFSVFSWAITLSKWGLFRKARVQSGRFLKAFRKAPRLQDMAPVASQFEPSPLVAVYQAGFEEYRRQVGNPLGTVKNVVAIQRATQIAASEELTRLERRLPWLATTGAVTPFIGLFGTVWGIIDAFHSLGTSGAA